MKSCLLRTMLGVGCLALIVIPNVAQAGYTIEASPNGTSASATSLDSYFTYGANTVIEVDEAGTLADYSASVCGYSGDDTYDYYSFSVGTGSSDLALNTSVAFDIDFAYCNGLDTSLVLYDTDGTTMLKYNDDNPVDGPGDVRVNTLNSFMTYTFDAAGTYYIRVSEFSSLMFYGDVLSADTTYHLHVSTLLSPSTGGDDGGSTTPTVPVPSSLLLITSGLGGLAAIRKRLHP